MREKRRVREAAPYGFILIHPSVRTGAPSPWKGEGWAGGPVCRPYGVYRSRPSLFRRGRTLAGPQMYAARPGVRALTGCRDPHGRPQGLPLRRIQHQYRWFGKARRRI